MGATAKGFPYPEPTDPVANTDLAIKALAQYLEDKAGVKAIHIGQLNVSLSSAAVASAGFTLPAGKFAAAPLAVAQIFNSSSLYTATVTSITATQVNVTVRKIDSVAVTATIPVIVLAVLLT